MGFGASRVLAAWAVVVAQAAEPIAVTTPAISKNASLACRACVAAADRGVEILETLRRQVRLNRGEPEVQHALDWLCEDVPEAMAHEGLASVEAHLRGRGVSRDRCFEAVERIDDRLERALLAEGGRDDLELGTTSMLQVRHATCHGPGSPCGDDAFEVNCPTCHLDAEFTGRRTLPAAHTCDGGGMSPPLEWAGAPRGTKSFALSLRQIAGPDDDSPLFDDDEEEEEGRGDDTGGGVSMRRVRFDHLWFGYDVPGTARSWKAGAKLPASTPHAPSASKYDRDDKVQQISTRIEEYSPPCIPSGSYGAFRFELLALASPPPLAVAPAPPRESRGKRRRPPKPVDFGDFARDAKRHVLATAAFDVFIHAAPALPYPPLDDEGDEL